MAGLTAKGLKRKNILSNLVVNKIYGKMERWKCHGEDDPVQK